MKEIQYPESVRTHYENIPGVLISP